MPTNRPRHTLTETPSVAEALQAAGERWPEDRGNANRLLRRLIERGAESVSDENGAARRFRADAIKRTAGQFTGVYEPGYLTALRDEWPD
jgi:hypothetical protein